MLRQKSLTLTALFLFAVLTVLLSVSAVERLRDKPFDPSLSALLPVTLTETGDPLVESALRTRLSGDEAQTVTILLTIADPAESRSRREADAVRARDAAAKVLTAAGLTLPAVGGQNAIAPFKSYAGRLMTDADRRFLSETLAKGDAAGTILLERSVRCLTSPASLRLLGFQADPFCLFDGWATERQAAARITTAVTAAGTAPMTLTDAEGESTTILVVRIPDERAQSGSGELSRLMTEAETAAKGALTGAGTLRFTAAGIPLFTDAIATRAQSELTLIGSVSAVGVILFALALFGSVPAALLMALTVGIGFWLGLAASLTVFDTLTLVTFVFGATLIGVTVDYSAHWFAGLAGSEASGFARQKRLFPSLTLAALSSAAAYGVLSLTPLPGLRQMSLLAAAGVLAAYSAVILLLPFASAFVRPHVTRTMTMLSETLPRLPRLTATAIRRPVVTAGLLILFALTAAGLGRLQTGSGIRDLQGAPDSLISAQAEVSRRLALPSPAQCFVIEAADIRTALTREKALRERIAAENTLAHVRLTGLGSWVADRDTEADGARLSRRAVEIVSPALEEMLGAVPLPPAATPFTVEALRGTPAEEAAKTFILADKPTGTALLVMLAGLSPKDLPQLAAAAADLEGVQFVDMTGHMSETLETYRDIVLGLLAAGLLLLFVLLTKPFGRDAWRAVTPAAIGILVAGAVSGWLGIPFTLFTALAMVLLLGIGADCGIFLASAPTDGRAWAAVFFAGVTTMLSFGLLAFSSTPALHAFGITVLAGELAVWLSAAALRPARSAFGGD